MGGGKWSLSDAGNHEPGGVPAPRFMKSAFSFLIVLTILFVFYLPTLQTIPNGADHYYMRDVGETQVVLNTWGTLHATGYPLYVITGNILVTVMRTLGTAPAAAPALVSLLWSVVALALVYALALHLLFPPLSEGEGPGVRVILPAMLVTLLFGLTRTVWIHAVIAEIYSFGLAILALLFVLALWRIPNRIYLLALVGGLGVFHHRALILAAPALIYAVWLELTADRRRLLHVVPASLLLGLVGFLPYLYLPLRAHTGASWVYGEPDTWAGFWNEFFGREAEQYIGLPDSWDRLVANANTVNAVLVTDLTAPGIALGVLGLLVALNRAELRRAAMTFLIAGVTTYLFHITLYTDILSALILPIIVSVAFGWLFLLGILMKDILVGTQRAVSLHWCSGLLVAVSLPLSWWFISQNRSLVYENWRVISDLTTNPTGLETVALVQNVPSGSTLMLPWGVRHHAVGFARDVLGELQHLTLVDHKADFGEIVARGMLVTPEYTFYNHPVSWWEERLGTRVYLRAAAPYLVQIDTQPERVPVGEDVTALEHALRCEAGSIILEVAWYAPIRPDRDLSVFVHLLDADGNLIAQGDQSAPVYGWRPLTTWEVGEVVRDMYVLPRLAGAQTIRYGLYQRLASGEFQNALEMEMPVECGDE